MDDAFSLVASRMPRARRLSPFGARMLVLLTLMGVLLTLFTVFVVTQQRAADARRARALEEQRAAQVAEAPVAATDDASAVDAAAVADLQDRQARDTADAALAAARAIATTDGIAGATTAGLSAVESDLVFADGRSTAPTVVSVYVTSDHWAAAVWGGETCYWVALTADGAARYGAGSGCTGLDALAADRPAW